MADHPFGVLKRSSRTTDSLDPEAVLGDHHRVQQLRENGKACRVGPAATPIPPLDTSKVRKKQEKKTGQMPFFERRRRKKVAFRGSRNQSTTGRNLLNKKRMLEAYAGTDLSGMAHARTRS